MGHRHCCRRHARLVCLRHGGRAPASIRAGARHRDAGLCLVRAWLAAPRNCGPTGASGSLSLVHHHPLKTPSMHLHIVGICGTFMGGIAAIARAAGHKVTGCDANVYPPMSHQLQELGIELIEGYEAAQLDTVANSADIFLIGNAISRGNPLLEAVLDAGLAYTSGPQWLAE